MSAFEVWAPKATKVEVVVGGRCVPMSRSGSAHGWWRANGQEAVAGTDYAFRIDGGPPLPDPRSPWQPYGIDRPSRLLDHAAFPWTDQAWRGFHLPSAVLYELHVGTFTPEGTFDAVIDRLDHLVDLGITAVELLPVAEFGGARGWGYDGVHLYAPHHAYGGPDGLKRLVDACHRRGLGVIMDVVYNHLGPTGNHLARFGPYFTDRYATGWGEAINYDGAHSGGARGLVIDNAVMWLRDYHCDGLRLDAVHAILDRSALHILEELAVRIDALSAQLGRPLHLIAESDLNDPRLIRPRAAGGYGLDASWSDEFHHALHAVLTGETSGYYEDFGSLANLAKALRQSYVYDGVWSDYRKRVHGRPPGEVPTYRLLAYLQNHDQVGNRAAGERITALTSVARTKIGAALVLTSPFVPMLFQGEEWGASSPFQYFTDFADPELGRAVSQGRRSEFSTFGWSPEDVPDPQDPATFERSKLDWSELDRPPHHDLLDWHRRLIALRRRLPDLTDPVIGATQTAFDEHAGWVVATRGRTTIACNLGTGPVTLPAYGRLVLASDPAVHTDPGHLRLPPDTIAILEADTQ